MTVTVSTPITAIAISHPATNESARLRPLDMLSKMITVTTDTGLVKAIARPSAATSAISVPTAIDHSDSGSVTQGWSELDPSAPFLPQTSRVAWAGRHGGRGNPQPKPGGCRAGDTHRVEALDVLGSLRESVFVDGRFAVSWNLKGSYVETCSCDLICPCNASFDHGATYDFCRVTLVFNIREGEIEGTDIGGLRVAAIADTPKVMTDGNWRLGVFVDERATDDQLDKLVKVFGGQLGGPMAGLAPLVGEMLGVERAAIEVIDDGVRHSVRVGDEIDFEIEDVVPFGVETGEPVRFAGMFHPVASDLTMAEAKRSRIK